MSRPAAEATALGSNNEGLVSDAAAIRADVIGRWILIIAAVVLPWLAFSVARRTIVRWPSVGRAVAVGGARVIAVIAGVFGVVFAMCAYPAPGAGPKARLGYREAAPIIQALDAYRNAQGGWPASIEELTPTFLANTVRDSRQNRVISG